MDTTKKVYLEIAKLWLIKLRRDHDRFRYLHKMLYLNWLEKGVINNVQGNYHFARTANKLYERMSAGMEEAQWADVQYDGGEWSGPAWGEIWQEFLEDVIDKVAIGYNVSPRVVSEQLTDYWYESHKWPMI